MSDILQLWCRSDKVITLVAVIMVRGPKMGVGGHTVTVTGGQSSQVRSGHYFVKGHKIKIKSKLPLFQGSQRGPISFKSCLGQLI